MKTVKGKIHSSAPISVTKAARTISKFAATDNGSSQAVGAYLRRASAAFNELKQLHKELQRPSKSDRKHKKSNSENTVEGAGESTLEPSVFDWTPGAMEPSQGASHGYGDSEGKKHKDKKKKEKGDDGNIGEDGEKTVIEEHGERRKNKKKQKGDRKIENFHENGVNMQESKMIDEEQREREKKKRKSIEIEGIENNSILEPRKKKKQPKNEGDNLLI